MAWSIFIYQFERVFWGWGVIEDTPGKVVVSTETPILSKFG